MVKKVQKSRLGSKHILHLDNLGVIPIIDDIAADIKSAFHILLMSSPKRLTVCAESGGEKAAWIEQITACANYAVSHWYGTLREIDSGSVWAPLWMPEMDVKLCTVCLQTKFSLLKSKHHCSLCGLVVCNSCSNNFVPIAKDTAIAAAVISSAKRASSSPDTLSNSGSTSSGNGLTNSNSSNGNNSSLGNNTNFGSSASLDSESNFSSTTALNSSIDSPNILTLNVRVCDPCLEKGINAIANHSKLAQWNCDLGVIEQELANARNVLAHNAPNATKTQTESLNELVETLGKKFNHYVANIARIEYVIECRTRKRANVRSGQKVTIKKAKNLYDTVQMGIRLTSESDI